MKKFIIIDWYKLKNENINNDFIPKFKNTIKKKHPEYIYLHDNIENILKLYLDTYFSFSNDPTFVNLNKKVFFDEFNQKYNLGISKKEFYYLDDCLLVYLIKNGYAELKSLTEDDIANRKIDIFLNNKNNG